MSKRTTYGISGLIIIAAHGFVDPAVFRSDVRAIRRTGCVQVCRARHGLPSTVSGRRYPRYQYPNHLPRLCTKVLHSVRVSGRLKIAQRFIAWDWQQREAKSVKRTAEKGII
jgi:hypothetical protein